MKIHVLDRSNKIFLSMSGLVLSTIIYKDTIKHLPENELSALLEEIPVEIIRHCCFMRGGAPPHFLLLVLVFKKPLSRLLDWTRISICLISKITLTHCIGFLCMWIIKIIRVNNLYLEYLQDCIRESYSLYSHSIFGGLDNSYFTNI